MLEKIKSNKMFAALLALYMVGLFVVVNYVSTSIDRDIDISKTNHGLIVYIACEKEKELESAIPDKSKRHSHCWATAEKISGVELKKFKEGEEK